MSRARRCIYFAPPEGEPLQYRTRRVGTYIKQFPSLKDVDQNRAFVTRLRDGFSIVLREWRDDDWERGQSHWLDIFRRFEAKYLGEISD